MTNPSDPDIRAANARAEHQNETPGGDAVTPMHPDPHSSAEPAVETPVEARQGFLGAPVLAVLIVGLLLTGIAGFAVHFAMR
jgi:hypothetical protein